ncbi:hypothetical protein [uncultured Microbacterium sp.]|uniref:hypothetical protein n=1 Tax=uncultured Microbacterium sp. TaxID=191216 RepID=UPI0028DCDDD6|nr:hypothetical protein [uncultured Microbacterium sp.]
MSEQPDVRWAPMEPKPRDRRRVWLVVALVAAALVVAGILLIVFLPRGDAAEPGSTPSPSASSSSAQPGSSPSPLPSGAPSASPEPSTPSAESPPVPEAPSIEAFRTQVSGWLTDAPRGLDIIAGSSGQDALPVLDTLQEDAQRLSDAQPPTAIDPQWRDAVSGYAQRLADLRTALTGGSASADAVDAARSSVQELRTLVGL